jgi:hypothetical protein
MINKEIKVWLILLLLTLFSFLLGWLKLLNDNILPLLLLATFIKGQLIIDYFLGLKNVSLKYRMIPTLWLLIVLLAIGYGYYL